MIRSLKENGVLIASITLLVLCFVFGGASREGVGGKIAIAILSSLVLGGFLIRDRQNVSPMRLLRPIGILTSLLFVWICVHLLPLPFSLWSRLSSRENLIDEMVLLDMPFSSQPISLAPTQTVIGGIMFMPAILAYYLGCQLPRKQYSAVFWCFAVLGFCSAILGLGQLSFPRGEAYHFWDNFNADMPVGIFANINHQATLLVVLIPVLGVLFNRKSLLPKFEDSQIARVLILAVMFLTTLITLLFAKSIAGYILGVLTVFLTGLAVFHLGRISRRKIFYTFGFLTGTALILIVMFNGLTLVKFGEVKPSMDELSRIGMIKQTLEIYSDHWLLGTGLGSFESVFPLYEDPATVTGSFVNHAHNDYLEWLVETGLVGGIILIGFLAWWAKIAYTILIGSFRLFNRYTKAAVIVTLVIAIHSLIDYPIRTLPISVIGALCLGIMSVSSDRGATLRRNRRQQLS